MKNFWVLQVRRQCAESLNFLLDTETQPKTAASQRRLRSGRRQHWVSQ